MQLHDPPVASDTIPAIAVNDPMPSAGTVRLRTGVTTKGVRPGSGMTIPFTLIGVIVCLGDVVAILAIGLYGSDSGVERLLLLAAIGFVSVARVSGAYDVDSLLFFKHGWPRVGNAWTTTVVTLATVVHALGMARALPIWVLLQWFGASLVSLTAMRAAMTLIVRRMKRAGAFDGRTAILGVGPQGIDLVDHVARADDLAVSFLGFFCDQPPSAQEVAQLPLPYLGDMVELVTAIRDGAVARVFVALPWSDGDRVQRVVDQLSATPVEIRLAPDRAAFTYARRRMTLLGSLSIITLLERPLTDVQQALKAIEDRVIATVLLIVFAPVMVAVAAAIRLTSPGPILFRQSREGFNCRPFEIWKFRTMHVDAAQAVVQAGRNDPRITPLGAILRRTSLDELPQLFNVLMGHMSLVGPRPHATSTRAGGRLFAEVAERYAARHRVKPGLTGWAQVCGWRGETDTEEKLKRRLEHDIYYVEHWSIWFDLYILARTAATVLVQRNAY